MAFVAGVGRKRGTTLTFWLSAPGRVKFTVLGKAPDCRRLGSFSRQGREGVNRMRFLGRLHGRPLAPGTYTLVPELVRGGKRFPLARVTVEIVAAGRKLTAAGRTKPMAVECRAVGVASRTSSGADRGSVSAGAGGSGKLSSSSGADVQTGGAAARGEGDARSEGGVAGVSRTDDRAAKNDPLSDLPLVSRIVPEDPPVPPLLLAVVALVVIALGSLALIGLVLRYFRGTWVP